MKNGLFKSLALLLLVLSLSLSLFLVSCGEEEAREPNISDVTTDIPTDDTVDTPTDDQTEDKPTADVPTEDEPGVDAPEADEPADEPTVDAPVTDEPAVDVPTVDTPTVDDEPTVDIPTVDEPTVDEPTVDEPTVDEPTVDEPTVDIPTVDEPTVDEPTEDIPTVEPEIPDENEKPDGGVAVLPDSGLNPVLPDNMSGTVTDKEPMDVSRAVANGLRSIVSVYCKYTYTTTYPWGGTTVTGEAESAGAGVIYSLTTDGSAYIITNFHVVYYSDSDTENNISDRINVYLYGMENTVYSIPATYIGGSSTYDVAVLRVNKSDVLKSAVERGVVKPVTVANSDLLVPGDTAIAIGSPNGETVAGISATTGIVSVDSEYINMSTVDGNVAVTHRVIRTDAAVNPGNSGGGLFNARGELIGIVHARSTDSVLEGVGYAIPSNIVIAVANNIIDNCDGKENESVLRPILGISTGVTALTTEYDAESGKIIKKETLIVSEIVAGGLSEGKLMVGDEIKAIRIDERAITVTRSYMVVDFMLNARVGDVVSLDVIREGEPITVNITITEACLKVT